MRALSFGKRTFKEIIRDPLNLSFGVAFPVVLMLLLSAIQKSVPVPLFEIQSLTPGIAVFGLAFMTLFTATLISKDRSTSFLQRLYTTPLAPLDFILGYTLPIIPIAIIQSVVCYLFAIILGLDVSVNILLAILLMIPTSVLFISLGLLFGSILNDKQVGGICGALLTNLTAWLSGAWFDLKLVGGAFEKIAHKLAFSRADELEKALFHGQFDAACAHILPIVLYSAAFTALAVWCFLRRMKKQ